MLDMKEITIIIWEVLALLYINVLPVHSASKNIINGIPWYDQNGKTVNAHGACIIQDAGKYWLFGEYKSDNSNAFQGFGCYSSEDLSNWRFERMALPVQKEGILGPNRVGERVKVMRCPKTGEYVMLMHADDLGYKDPYIGIATSKTINGEYKVKGALTYNGQPIKKWDMGVFQDEDGKGYLLIHHGPIYRLTDDYLSIDTLVAHVNGMGESPAMFKKNGMYYLLSSNLTSWERNDNFYFTATSLEGPWKSQGLFCPEGSLTWNSQCTFVLMLPDGTPMYMGDRWSYPHQASCATYVWMPMQAEGEKLSIPTYWHSWDIQSKKPSDVLETASEVRPLSFHSKDVRKEMRIRFKGTHVALHGKTGPHGGYASITMLGQMGDTLYSSMIDCYSKVPHEGIRLITPELKYGDYTLIVKPTGDYSTWSDKKQRKYGADDCWVSLDKAYIFSTFTNH